MMGITENAGMKGRVRMEGGTATSIQSTARSCQSANLPPYRETPGSAGLSVWDSSCWWELPFCSLKFNSIA